MRLAAIACLCLAVPAVAEDVKLEPVSLEGLEKAVAAHKGKIVVIDVWANFCVPCKEKFPHMVMLANKHAKDGVVFISLTVDEKEDEAKALEFLKKNKATFQNFILEDKDRNEKAGDARLYHSAPPIVHVYGRDGKKVKEYEGKKQAGELDQLLLDMIKK